MSKRRAYADLAHYFKDSGDTQEAFAARVGMDQSKISRIKNRFLEPSLSDALLIAKKANIPIESLIAVAETVTPIEDACNA